MTNVVFWDVTRSVCWLPVSANIVPSSPILVTLMREWRYIPPKRPFLQERHGVTSQKTLSLDPLCRACYLAVSKCVRRAV
jgi:hypothetical protein